MAVEDDPQQAASGAAGGGNGGIVEEVAVVQRLCFAAESPRELRRAIQVRVCMHVCMWKGQGVCNMHAGIDRSTRSIDLFTTNDHTPQKFVVPLVTGTGGTEPPPQGGYPRPVTRALALLLVEVALSATANDYKTVGRAVREAVAAGLAAGASWPLLPEVLATVLTGACVRVLALGILF